MDNKVCTPTGCKDVMPLSNDKCESELRKLKRSHRYLCALYKESIKDELEKAGPDPKYGYKWQSVVRMAFSNLECGDFDKMPTSKEVDNEERENMLKEE